MIPVKVISMLYSFKGILSMVSEQEKTAIGIFQIKYAGKSRTKKS